MTTRERILSVLNFQKPDRMPAVMFGFWRELLQEWEADGVLKKGTAMAWRDGNEVDFELLQLLNADYNWQTFFNTNTFLSPSFNYEIIERRADGFVLRQNHLGVVEILRDGAEGIPGEHDWLLKDRESFDEHYRERLQCSPSRTDLKQLQNKWNKRNKDLPFGLHLGSLFGETRNMLTLMGLSYLMADDEDLLIEICNMVANICYENAKTVLEYSKKNGIVFDYAHYWEDICFKNGPLISPALFDSYCGANYKRINDLCKSFGINFISLDCDGVIESLLPTWINNGVNVMFPLEIGTWGDQFQKAREKFGKSILGVGAFDKTVLRIDKTAVDAELKRVREVAELKGFIPCPDHRLMPGTKLELARYYFEKVKEM